MAKNKLTSADKVGGVSAEDLRKAIEEISRQKSLASEYAGLAGKATQGAVERHGLEKNALTFTRRIHDMEENKRSSVIYSSIDYWNKLGLFDQGDAFNDPIELFREIVAQADAARGTSKPEKRKLPAEDKALNDALTH
ncbi:hypothetical protein [Kaistia sp. MMO-174]|uniref:hypothetical protein n=1 Tax=Kaistia sp. MMO-174 TaxID=3081256 RepID=UPI003016324A